MDNLANQATLAQKENQVYLVYRAKKDFQVFQESKVNQGSQAHQVYQVNQYQDHRDHLANQVIRAKMDYQGSQALKEKVVYPDFRAYQGSKEKVANQDSLAKKENRVFQVYQVKEG